MKLATITICGFRCYGDAPVTLKFDDLTALVGANGSGKSAVLVALQRMFGTTTTQRSLTKDDFHIAGGAPEATELSLWIEALFSFPELRCDAEADNSAAVPECLRHILATSESEGDTPQCRIRLRATWRKTPSVNGDVEQCLEWIDTLEPDPIETSLHPLLSRERSLIQLFYVPASRDAERELRYASGTILSRALEHVAWSQETRDSLLALTKQLATGLRVEADFLAFETQLKDHWTGLHGEKLGKPELSIAEADLATTLRRLDTRLVSGTSSLPITFLSEGERSLLYFALVIAALKFENANSGKSAVATLIPVLTILAVEEPENHLAPYYLSRILKGLRGITHAQVALTSHSASILRRIRPEEVRHFRVAKDGKRVVSEIILPKDDEEALKYVREAVQAHPELYFASVVVLGEGASEEVVLPRVARALDVDVDPQFVAVVPLGGRHVHHLWRLLRTLGTPHATLVDLDMCRHEGGWMRLHALAQTLVDSGEKPEDVRGTISEAAFSSLRSRAPLANDDDLTAYLGHLEERFSIFLSAPLDLDMLNLIAFDDAYKKLAPKRAGPRIPTDESKRSSYLAAAIVAVLGHHSEEDEHADVREGVASEKTHVHSEIAIPATDYYAAYSDADRALFPWYRYLFLQGSKPVAHARALASLDDKTIAAGCPSVLRRLLARVKELAERSNV
jgi:putative ATP-dependent endonuclease of OLD family